MRLAGKERREGGDSPVIRHPNYILAAYMASGT
jgi:hypothetical protein